MQLSHRVKIEQKIGTYDAIGQPIETWVTVVSIWAHVKFLRGLEFIKSNQDVTYIQASMRTRKRSDVTTAMRATYDGVAYNIVAILPQSSSVMDLAVERVA